MMPSFMRCYFLAIVVSSSVAFSPRTLHCLNVPSSASMTTVLCAQRLSEIDEMCIENMAEYCLKAENTLAGGECDVEEYQALVNQLRDQRAILVQHVEYVDSLLSKLQATPGGTVPAEDTKETYFAG